MPLGIYISVPFCRTKCSYCNFASDVFSRAVFERYVDRICSDIENAPQAAADMSAEMELTVDSIYLGGGTPTVLEAAQLQRIFAAVRQRFDVTSDAEITVECAPGTLTEAMIESMLRCGVNRISLGVQSFVDQEAAAVGRLHKRAIVLAEIDRLREADIANINIDLIAGLPHQTAESWSSSLSDTIETGVPHVSVYMLEVDEDSRLGSELLAGGKRYHAHFVPDEDTVADFYLYACDRLQSAGIVQYEISNFAREGFVSKHNLKYWTRQPYFGFGIDAHSMLLPKRTGQDFDCADCEQKGEAGYHTNKGDIAAVRFASADSLEKYMSGARLQPICVSQEEALEENFFLGLRHIRGVNLRELSAKFGEDALDDAGAMIAELITTGLLERRDDFVRLTSRGRLLSNEVFVRFIQTEKVVT
jgi:oxygen-independent coproporphyrinogen III oxidase